MTTRKSSRVTKMPQRYSPEDFSTDESEPATDSETEMYTSEEGSDSTGSLAEFIASDEDEIDVLEEYRSFIRTLCRSCDEHTITSLLRAIETRRANTSQFAALIQGFQDSAMSISV